MLNKFNNYVCLKNKKFNLTIAKIAITIRAKQKL